MDTDTKSHKKLYLAYSGYTETYDITMEPSGAVTVSLDPKVRPDCTVCGIEFGLFSDFVAPPSN